MAFNTYAMASLKKERKQIFIFVLIGFQKGLSIKKNGFRRLFLAIYQKNFLRNTIREECDFKGFEPSDIPLPVNKIFAMLVENGPIEFVC